LNSAGFFHPRCMTGCSAQGGAWKINYSTRGQGSRTAGGATRGRPKKNPNARPSPVTSLAVNYVSYINGKAGADRHEPIIGAGRPRRRSCSQGRRKNDLSGCRTPRSRPGRISRGTGWSAVNAAANIELPFLDVSVLREHGRKPEEKNVAVPRAPANPQGVRPLPPGPSSFPKPGTGPRQGRDRAAGHTLPIEAFASQAEGRAAK